jgi:hypothetical protein
MKDSKTLRVGDSVWVSRHSALRALSFGKRLGQVAELTIVDEDQDIYCAEANHDITIWVNEQEAAAHPRICRSLSIYPPPVGLFKYMEISPQ